MLIRSLAPLSFLFCAWSLGAQENLPEDVPPPPPIAIGERTMVLLELQRSGGVAGEFRPMQGETAVRAQQRYLEAFKRPLPSVNETGNSTAAGGSSAATTK